MPSSAAQEAPQTESGLLLSLSLRWLAILSWWELLPSDIIHIFLSPRGDLEVGHWCCRCPNPWKLRHCRSKLDHDYWVCRRCRGDVCGDVGVLKVSLTLRSDDGSGHWLRTCDASLQLWHWRVSGLRLGYWSVLGRYQRHHQWHALPRSSQLSPEILNRFKLIFF